jgi:hypothetical protein
MTEQAREEVKDLTTLDGIRAHFEARQRALGKGFHALGDEVLSAFWQAGEQLPKPVSAMTFRNFLQGKTTLRDPTGLELYFRALGASDGEMRAIRATLQHELDRRLASPRQQAALRPIDEVELEAMPYSRALVECEVVTRLEDSVAAPLTHLTPREYLLGPDGQREASADPERWGLVQHLDELASYISRLDQTLEDELEEIPRRSQHKRRVQSAADVREVLSAYAHWLLYRPRAADLFFSRRRYMLHGLFPDEHRELAIALARRVGRVFFRSIERLAIEAVLEGKAREDALKAPEAENALEHVTQSLLDHVHGYYHTVVQGSLGTGAAFRASYQYRRDNRDRAEGWNARHERLVTSYDQAVSQANRALEEDVRIPYGKLKAIYDAQFAATRPVMFELWESDYAPLVVQKALSLLVSDLHRVGVLNDKLFLGAMKELFASRSGTETQNAKHERRRYERLEPR